MISDSIRLTRQLVWTSQTIPYLDDCDDESILLHLQLIKKDWAYSHKEEITKLHEWPPDFCNKLSVITSHYLEKSWAHIHKYFAAVFQCLFQYSPFSADFLVLHKPQFLVSCLNTQDLLWDQLLHSYKAMTSHHFSGKLNCKTTGKSFQVQIQQISQQLKPYQKTSLKSTLAILKTKHKTCASNLVSSWNCAVHAKEIHSFRKTIYTWNYSYRMEGRKYFYFYFMRKQIIPYFPSVSYNSFKFERAKYWRS